MTMAENTASLTQPPVVARAAQTRRVLSEKVSVRGLEFLLRGQ